MSACVTTKDRLIALIDDAEGLDALVEACSQIIVVLVHTEGLWVECGYAYKAKEIAERAVNRLNDFAREVDHHKSLQRIAKYRDALRTLSDRYHMLNHARFQGDDYLLKCLRDDNHELAA